MLRYIAKRLLFAIPTIFGVFVVVFFVIRLIPGDPAVTMLGPKATDAQIAVYRAAHGLNDSLALQFSIALKSFIKGDLGSSLSLYRPVSQVILERFPRTAELAFFGIIIGFILAVFLGVIAAIFRGKWPDITLISFSTLGMSLPTFYVGLWVLYIFALKLKIIPVISSMDNNISYWKSLLGPLLTIAIGETALLLRITRSSMLEILNEDFIRTARAKGLREMVVLFKHALGNSLIPIVTVTGYSLATAFGGAIVLETVFARQGIGKLLIDAITVRDYPLVQGTTIVIAILMILVNIITDVIYGYVDPRIRIMNDE
ncbi:MAG: ABC transporter permease [Firmicutes bacterium]|nr:ABC transporter permease [Bacillota bacterium]